MAAAPADDQRTVAASAAPSPFSWLAQLVNGKRIDNNSRREGFEDNRTPFGKILRGELPAHILHEDHDVLCFRDIAPVQEFHGGFADTEEAGLLNLGCLRKAGESWRPTPAKLIFITTSHYAPTGPTTPPLGNVAHMFRRGRGGGGGYVATSRSRPSDSRLRLTGTIVALAGARAQLKFRGENSNAFSHGDQKMSTSEAPPEAGRRTPATQIQLSN